MKGVTRNRLTTVIIATIVFSLVGLSVARALNMPMELVLIGAPLSGLLISSFEVFYFQTHRGRWLREMHPLKSNFIYILILVATFLVVQHVNYLVHGRWNELPLIYELYPVLIPLFLLVALLGVIVIQVVSFIGGKNIFHLLVGKYHRPV